MFQKHKFTLFFFIVLYGITLILMRNVPALDDYYYRADEGTYLRQATAIKNEGVTKIAELTDAYILNAHSEQTFPHPLRIGHILLSAIVLNVYDSILSLSYLSIFFFVLIAITVFVFIKKWFDGRTAFIAASMVAASPLLCGISERALADIDFTYFLLLSFFLLIDYLKDPNKKNQFLLIASISIAILFKEVAILFLPFYAIVMLLVIEQQQGLSYPKIATVLLTPLLVSGFILLGLVGSNRFFDFLGQFLAALKKTDPYLTDFSSGPWYVYLIDLIILSPIVFLLSVFYIGEYIYTQKKNLIVTLLITFCIYFLVSFTLFPKDIRFGIIVDIVFRILSALCIVQLIDRFKLTTPLKSSMLLVVLVLFISMELLNFKELFLTNKIYDPASYYLLKAKKIIPQ